MGKQRKRADHWQRLLSIFVTFGLAGLLVVLFLPTLQPVPARAQPNAGEITLNPSSVTITGCEVFTVSVMVNATDVYGADVRLAYDPAILEAVDTNPGASGIQMRNGTFLTNPMILRITANNTTGIAEYVANQVNPTPPASGYAALFLIPFRAKASGTTTLHFVNEPARPPLADRNGVIIATTFADGSASTVPPTAPTLSISKLNATDARLSWSSASEAASYRLFRDIIPYFTPGTAYQTTSGLSYDDLGSIGDSAVNHYYTVRSVCANSFSSPNSNRVGEFDYDLVPGTAVKDYINMIALPLDVSSQIDMASEMAAYVGSGVRSVLQWNAATQTYLTYIPGSPIFPDFPTSTGQAYRLRLRTTAPTIVSFVGSVPEPGEISFNLEGASTCKTNQISLPLDKGAITSASLLNADILDVRRALHWVADTQSYESYPPAPPIGTNFSTRIGYPYVVCMFVSKTWP